MALGLFLRGLIMGFSIAAPVGPIGVLCIRRTLAEGRAMGVATGGVSAFRSRFDERALGWVNRVSGAIIILFGVLALAGLARTEAS